MLPIKRSPECASSARRAGAWGARRVRLGACAGLLAVLAVAAPAQAAPAGVKIGILSCVSVPGQRLNLVVHSRIGVRCVFLGPRGQERYTGRTGIALGLDLNWRRREQLAFVVIAGSADVRPQAHALAGRYVGAKAGASLGLGAGVAVLVGGGRGSIGLQPLGVQGSTGLSIEGGLGYLTLEPAPSGPPANPTRGAAVEVNSGS